MYAWWFLSLDSNGSSYNLVEGSLFLLHTTLFSKYTLYSFLSYVTLHCASHNTAIVMRDGCANPGTVFALVSLYVSHGMFVLHVCVDLITLPSGRFIEIGFDVGNNMPITTGVPGRTKYHVAPVSATAISTSFFLLRVLKQVAALGKSQKKLS